jgi:hypothetical protein
MASYACPYCGKVYDTTDEVYKHEASAHGLYPVKTPLEVPTTSDEVTTFNALLISDKIEAEAPRALIEKGSITTVAKATTDYGKVGMSNLPDLTPLTEAKPTEDLAGEWTKKIILSGAINVGSLLTYIANVVPSFIPFTNAAPALNAIWQMPAIRGANDFATDVMLMPYNVVQRRIIERYLLSQAKPIIPEQYRLALAASKALLDDTTYKKYMSENGLAPYWADIWRDENYQYPSLGQLFSQLWRGVISSDTFKLWLIRQGYPTEVASSLLPLAELIPPSSDLITMVIREAFVPEMVTPAPDVFAENMAKQGFSKTWADRYWTAHWVPMPLTQAYANLWRGYWGKDEFMNLLKIADFHPIWREAIYNVAFNPPSIRELGYGWDVNKYTLEDIIRYRRMEGLSEEDAKKAAESLIDYRLEAEREALRREWEHLYALGRLPEDDFRKNLEAVFSMNNRTDLWVERGKLEAQRIAKEGTVTEPRIVTSSEALWAFKAGLRSEDWLRGALDALEWDKSRIDLAVERAIVEMTPAPVVEKPVEYKQLSLSQIQDLYNLGKIDYDGLIAELQVIGYSIETATTLADLTVVELSVKTTIKTWSRADLADMYDLAVIDEDMLFTELQNLGYDEYHAAGLCLYTKVAVNLPDIKARYSKGWIDDQTLYYELLRLWYPEPTAEALSKTLLSEELRKLWTPEARATTLYQTIVAAEKTTRTVAEKDLTKAEIIKGAKSGVLSVSEATDLLMDIGYNSDEATYLLMINAVVAAGDPDGYWETKRLTEAYKKALGLPYKEVPEELITYEKQLKELHAEVDKLKAEHASDEAIADAVLRLAGVEARYRTIVASWDVGE